MFVSDKEIVSVSVGNLDLCNVYVGSKEIWSAELIVWTDLAFSNNNHDSGSYWINEETVQDLTDYDTLDISVTVTFYGLYRGSNDCISLFVDDKEYVLVKNEWLEGEQTITESLDISEFTGEHTIKLWVKSNSASDVYWAYFNGKANMKLTN